MKWWLLTAALTGAASVTVAAEFVDDFEGGANEAAWAFIRGGDTLESSGGNPGWWLHQRTYDTFAPTLESSFDGSTPFTGDYRATGVTEISFDARTDAVDFGDGSGFNMTLVLRDTNGTPTDFDDDDIAYFVGPNVPRVGEGWVSYVFDVPSQSDDALPAGWKGGWAGDCENFRPGVTWLDIMTSVDRVEMWWIDPCFFAAFQQWNVGADNLRIAYTGGSTPVESASWSRIKSMY